MVITALIIPHRPFLDTLLGHIQRNMNQTVLGPLRCQDSKFHRIQGRPGITACHICKKVNRLLRDISLVAAHPLLLIIDGASQQFCDIFLCKRFQFKNPGTRNKSAVDLKIRILRRRSNQKQSPILHKGQQIVLLALIEPVNLIYKKNSLLAVHPQGIFCLLHNLLHILLSRNRCIQLLESGACRTCYDFGQRRLACPRWAVKYNRAQLIRLDSPVKQLVLSDNMLLPHHLVQRGWPEPGGQRSLLLHRIASHIVK